MRVTVYTTKHCGYCYGARALLERLGIPYENVDVTGDGAARAALVGKALGRRTVPVIVIDDEVIGGYVELARMVASGELQRRFEHAQTSAS
jgi:glutaredoxin 3